MTDASGFSNLISFIESELDFPTTHYNDDYLKRRLKSRMRRTGCETYSEYLSRLRSTPEEHRELLDTFSINVTEFFRNNRVWDGIRKILHRLTECIDGTINVWSAGCADGREPYSLALLALTDPGIDASRIEILATDINETALSLSRRAIYEKTMTEDIPSQLAYLEDIQKYIHEKDGVFTLDDSVTELVTFEHHDLINGNPKSGFDLVLCRNLLIYIDAEYEPEVLNTIKHSLCPERYLVIGKSETIPPNLLDDFDPLNNRHRIYRITPEATDCDCD